MDMQNFFIDENMTVFDAMNKLNFGSKKVVFVVKDKKLIAALTDGDVRRWILKNGDLRAEIKNIANYNPIHLNIREKRYAQQYMDEHSIYAIPILNDDLDIVSIIFKDKSEVKNNNMFNVPVVIMAGGLGKRLEPYTKILPKPLIPVGDIPITEHIINNFFNFGVKNFYLILNHKKNMIKAYFNDIDKEYNINYIDEESFMGTAGGLSLLKNKISETFILSNCDILVLEDYNKIYNFHKKSGNLITVIASLKNFKIPYGTIDITNNGSIKQLKEKPELSYFINTGMYIIEPIVINEIEENKNIDFPDVLNKYIELNKRIGIFPISENSWLDMGEFDKMEEMNNFLNNQKNYS